MATTLADNRDCEHDTDQFRVQTFGLEPDRKERHLDAGQDKQRCIKRSQTRDEAEGRPHISLHCLAPVPSSPVTHYLIWPFRYYRHSDRGQRDWPNQAA